ncbi:MULTISPECIES: hypothetical protein [Trichocoleus]|nr:hypothetical protein [Trichocoleus sp. FACHB-262]
MRKLKQRWNCHRATQATLEGDRSSWTDPAPCQLPESEVAHPEFC